MTLQPLSADDDLREWFWRCSLNLQNAAIKSVPQIAHPCDADHFADDAMRMVDALIAQRVSAETERWQNRDRQRLEQISTLQETVQSFQSARDERPPPPKEITLPISDTNDLTTKSGLEEITPRPNCGDQRLPCDVWVRHIKFGMGVRLQTLADAAARWLAAAQQAERPAPEGPQPAAAVDYIASIYDVLKYRAKNNASPAAVVDYTERALQAARDAVENVPSELWIDRRNSETIAQAIAPDFAEFASAAAAERDAAAIRAFGQRVWSDTEEVAYQAGVSDTRTRLQEPDVREAVARAMCKRRNTKQCAAICLSHSSLIEAGKCPEIQTVWGEDADAAIAKITEIMK